MSPSFLVFSEYSGNKYGARGFRFRQKTSQYISSDGECRADDGISATGWVIGRGGMIVVERIELLKLQEEAYF